MRTGLGTSPLRAVLDRGQAAQTLPFLIFAVPIGEYDGKLPRRSILLAADAARFSLVAAIALLGAALPVPALAGLLTTVNRWPATVFTRTRGTAPAGILAGWHWLRRDPFVRPMTLYLAVNEVIATR